MICSIAKQHSAYYFFTSALHCIYEKKLQFLLTTHGLFWKSACRLFLFQFYHILIKLIKIRLRSAPTIVSLHKQFWNLCIYQLKASKLGKFLKTYKCTYFYDKPLLYQTWTSISPITSFYVFRYCTLTMLTLLLIFF